MTTHIKSKKNKKAEKSKGLEFYNKDGLNSILDIYTD